jgi:hypothetical protein
MTDVYFTPEPWDLVVETTRDGDIHIDICDNSGHFVGLVVNNANIGVEEALANAKLMRAAPEMYRLLWQVADVMDDSEDCGEIPLERIEALLREIRGESDKLAKKPQEYCGFCKAYDPHKSECTCLGEAHRFFTLPISPPCKDYDPK